MNVDETNIGNLTDGLAMDTVVSEGSMEMDANNMDANDSQTSRQVQLVNDDSALPCQHDETAEAKAQSPPVEVEVPMPGNEKDVTASFDRQERGPINTPASPKKKQKRGSHQGGNDKKKQLVRIEQR